MTKDHERSQKIMKDDEKSQNNAKYHKR
jgi:hypothetical protein